MKGHYVRRVGDHVEENRLIRVFADDHRINAGISVPQLTEHLRHSGSMSMDVIPVWRDGRYCLLTFFRVFFIRRMWDPVAGMYFVFEAIVFRDYGDNDRVYSVRRDDKQLVQKAIDRYVLGQRPLPATD